MHLKIAGPGTRSPSETLFYEHKPKKKANVSNMYGVHDEP